MHENYKRHPNMSQALRLNIGVSVMNGMLGSDLGAT